MFNTNGEMRLATSKSTLKNNPVVEVTGRSAPKITIVINGGSAILCAVHLPLNSAMPFDNVVSYVVSKTRDGGVYLMIDTKTSSKESLAHHGGRKQASVPHLGLWRPLGNNVIEKSPTRHEDINLKLKFRHYAAIHTNYTLSNCTISSN